MTMPVATRYFGETIHARLGEDFYDLVQAADFPELVLRFRNQRYAARIGLDTLTENEWLAHFGRFKPLPHSFEQPLALRYHGHQFGVYNPDLGDGRGFLFAQVRDSKTNHLLDLGTKGSGQTPWSRAGDGRLTLKGGVREILASEMLEALGVSTSKSFSLFETGESLHRHDEPSPTRAAVLVRLSHSHIRIGTFQRLAFQGKTEEIAKLVQHIIAYYFPHLSSATNPVTALFDAAVTNVARMGAQYFSAGFVHGVLNTDNITLLGESFDYGPWRFLPTYHPLFTAAYFDETGRYAFGRQPEAMLWALARLAETFLPLASQETLKHSLEQFLPRFKQKLAEQTLALMGLSIAESQTHAAQESVSALYLSMRETQIPFAQCLFDLWGGCNEKRLQASPCEQIYKTDIMQDALKCLRQFPHSSGYAATRNHPYFSRKSPTDLLIDQVEEIWAPINQSDDWRLFEQQIADTRLKGDAYATLLSLNTNSTEAN
jgi:serine/tyrosine/threonine adenylyltransferase